MKITQDMYTSRQNSSSAQQNPTTGKQSTVLLR